MLLLVARPGLGSVRGGGGALCRSVCVVEIERVLQHDDDIVALVSPSVGGLRAAREGVCHLMVLYLIGVLVHGSAVDGMVVAHEDIVHLLPVAVDAAHRLGGHDMTDVQKTVESLGRVGDKHGNAFGTQSAIDGVDAVVRHLLMLDGHLPGGSGLSWNFIQPEKIGPGIRLLHQGINILLVIVVVADRDENLPFAEAQGLFQGRNPQGRRVAVILFQCERPDLCQCQVCHAAFAVGHAVHGLVRHEHERVVPRLSHVDRHGSTTLLYGFLYGVERVLGRSMPVATMGDEHHGGVFLVEELLTQVRGVVVALHGIVDGKVYFGLLCGFLLRSFFLLLCGKSDDAGA